MQQENFPTKESPNKVPDSRLKAYLLGNTRFPQLNTGIDILMLEEYMLESEDDQLSFATAGLSDEQLELVVTTMQRHHGARSVSKVPTKERLQDLWYGFSRTAQDLFYLFLETLYPDVGRVIEAENRGQKVSEEEKHKVDLILRDPKTEQKIKDVIAGAKNALFSKEVDDLVAKYRTELGKGKGVTDEAEVLRQLIFSKAMTGLESVSPECAKAYFDYHQRRRAGNP